MHYSQKKVTIKQWFNTQANRAAAAQPQLVLTIVDAKQGQSDPIEKRNLRASVPEHIHTGTQHEDKFTNTFEETHTCSQSR